MTANMLPRDDGAECTVLERCLVAPGAVETVRSILVPEAFDNVERREIYEALLAMRDAGKEIDLPDVVAWFKDRGKAGLPVINALRAIHAGEVSVHVEQNARRLMALLQVRKLAHAGNAIWAKATSAMGDPVGFIQASREQLNAVLDQRQSSDDAGTLKDTVRIQFQAMHDAATRGGGLLGPTTGIPQLDQLTNGLMGGKLWVLGARPGHGKTSLGMNLAISAADVPDRRVSVFVASAEMSRGELVTRMCASEGEVDARRVMTGAMVSEEWSRVTQSAQYLSSLPIYVDGTSPVTVFDIKGRVRRYIDELNSKDDGVTCRLVVVDYLQRVEAKFVKGRSREQEVAEIARELKQLAKDTNTCVVALAQVGRDVEKKGEPPKLSDLRESGNIENEADVVVFIHHPDGHQTEGRSELHIAKHRGGPLGMVSVKWTPWLTKFSAWEGLEPEPVTFVQKKSSRGGQW